MESAGATFLGIDEIDAGLNEVAGHVNAQHARLVDLTVALLADESAWAGPGVYRAEQYLAWKTGLSSTRAKQIVTIARRATELPVSMDAFRRGELAVDQVYAIASRAPWWSDREVCELARYATVHQLRNALGRYPFPEIANPAAPPEPQPELAEESEGSDNPDGEPMAESSQPPQPEPVASTPAADRIWFGLGDDGRFRLDVECDELTGMILTNALREARDQLFRNGHVDVNWVDALREIAERSLTSVTDTARRDRYRIHVHIDTDGSCSDDRGWNLPETVRRHVTCDGLFTPTFIEAGLPISVGRSRRAIPERTRRLVILRDQGCAVPGCTQTHLLEVHHIIHWEDDGPTDTFNLIALCPHHHRLHHKGSLGIAGNADDGTVVFTDHNGNLLRPSGARPEPPGAPPPPPDGTYQHPLGERLDYEWLYFNPPPEDRPTAWPRKTA
jgi:hypothetical protein